MNCLLTEKLPCTVRIDKKDVSINTDFRASIEFELIMQDDMLSDEEKLIKILLLYYNQIPENINEALEQCLWFYSCGKLGKKRKSSKTLYRFDTDAEYIYSAFLAQYGMDIVDIPYMHWWKFRSLFLGLDEENEFVKIMGYRGIEISGKMTNEQKRFYKKMKERYKIPMSEKKNKMIKDIEDALLSGGDLNQIMQR